MIEIAGPRLNGDERAWLVERLERAIALLSAPVARFSIRLVGDDEMSRLHEQAMGDPTTTDVLAWSEHAGARACEVDLAICVDEAARHATRIGHACREEILLYAVHGVLHAIGFDDHTAESFDAMHREEARILEAIGGRARVEPMREHSTDTIHGEPESSP